MRTFAPLDRCYSSSCCCCHVRTGTIILGVWYMLINGVVLLILLSALGDPDHYKLAHAEFGTDCDFTDDTSICIATAISLLMITICGMATYGAYKQRSAWIVPFFCYQIFDFTLNALVAISVVVYPSSIQDYLRQLPDNIPYKEDITSMNPTCLLFIVMFFISAILAFKAYLIGCVWNCYRYINARHTADVLVYVANDTTVLLPNYDETVLIPEKDPPPPYVSA
ncbi:lysosomal-associated transmembrane protein 4B [Amblyraja radiata]|uniref:lysosomal-associated transmembrane protein 4B n=1 Tax=Amblyraja radiata TaxID=386614 RepID=UPI0014025481|nr:lysosomal-associated transmembrane protein 4B [Amblyraja radiata]XP_055490292.1 lysosomal-associated transmembrane protein 4B [Leucoraja erinacea]